MDKITHLDSQRLRAQFDEWEASLEAAAALHEQTARSRTVRAVSREQMESEIENLKFFEIEAEKELTNQAHE